MSILSGITQVGAIVEAARDIIEVLRPRAKAGTSQVANHSGGGSSATTGKCFLDELNKASLHFIQLRDRDGNGSLDVAELGLGALQFRHWDSNGGGALTVAELNQAYLNNPGAFSANNLRLKV